MILDGVSIVNFQKHGSFDLEFSPGLNVIIGPTDSGKSSVIRAIRWAATNRPQGHQFRTIGTELTQVQLNARDEIGSVVLVRSRGEDVNRYRLLRNLVDSKYEKFGTGVPEEVARRFPWGPTKIGTVEVEAGFAMQHDPPFLLGWSGRERAELLDAICGNDVLAWAAGDLNREITALGRDEAQARGVAAELREQIDGLGDIEAERSILDGVEVLLEEARDLRARSLLLEDLLDRVKETRASRSAAAKALEVAEAALPGADEVVSIGEQIGSIMDLGRFVIRVRATAVALEEVENQVRLIDRTLEAASVFDKATASVARITALLDLHYRASGFSGARESAVEGMKSLDAETREIEVALKKMVGKACPACGRPLDQEMIWRITRR